MILEHLSKYCWVSLQDFRSAAQASPNPLIKNYNYCIPFTKYIIIKYLILLFLSRQAKAKGRNIEVHIHILRIRILYAEWHFVECLLSVIMLNVIMLSVIMLSVIMLSVLAPYFPAKSKWKWELALWNRTCKCNFSLKWNFLQEIALPNRTCKWASRKR